LQGSERPLSPTDKENETLKYQAGSAPWYGIWMLIWLCTTDIIYGVSSLPAGGFRLAPVLLVFPALLCFEFIT
jgi:hypothetical protein